MADRRKLLVVAAAIVVGGLVALVLLLTGVVGDSDDSDSTDPGEANAFEPVDDNTIVAVNRSFDPDSVELEVGDAVAFVNEDDVAHTFTADDGSFDSRSVEPDGTYGYTVVRPGTIDFHCEIHPLMTGTVVVTD